MEVEVLWFASLADRTGTRAERIEVQAGERVTDLWHRLRQRHPALAEVTVRPAVACDLRWAGWDAPLDGVREVAFLPPVSGG